MSLNSKEIIESNKEYLLIEFQSLIITFLCSCSFKMDIRIY